MTARDSHLHCARVYLAEARRRRGQLFALVLLRWAGNQRRLAMECTRQGELFA